MPNIDIRKIFRGIAKLFRKNSILALGIAAAISILGPLLLYVYFLHRLPIPSTNPSAWADFGTYFGGVVGPFVAVLNLIVVVYISVQVTKVQQESTSKKRFSLDLYEEWHGSELHESRTVVHEQVDLFKGKGKPLPALSAMESATTREISKQIHRVYHFFEKWALLKAGRYIDSRLLDSLMGNYVSWYRVSFFHAIRNQEADSLTNETLTKILEFVFGEQPDKVAPGSKIQEDSSTLIKDGTQMDPIAQISAFLDQLNSKNQLAPICLSTISPSGYPNARFVDLKEVSDGLLYFGTDERSTKAKEFLANPKVSISAWWDRIQVQVRVMGTIEKAPESLSNRSFSARSLTARAIATISTQSEVLVDPEGLKSRIADFLKNAGSDIPRPETWSVYGILPEEIEILTFSEDRVHARKRYKRMDGSWSETELYP